jgi:hypothetical protein
MRLWQLGLAWTHYFLKDGSFFLIEFQDNIGISKIQSWDMLDFTLQEISRQEGMYFFQG